MFIELVRKIESYLDEISQYANNGCWESAQSDWILVQEEDIEYELETYPNIVSNLFNDILSMKSEMDEAEDSSFIYDIESLIEELICLIKEYEITPTISPNDNYNLSDYNWNPTNVNESAYEYQEYLDKYFVSESRLRLAADIERATAIYKFIKNAGSFVTREKILREFSNTSVKSMNIALGRDDILSYDSVYIAADNLHISNSAKQGMLFSLSKLAQDRMQHNISELFDYAKVYNNDFLLDAKISNSHQLFSVVAYLFSDEFSFMRPYFATYGVRMLSADDQLKKYLVVSGNHSIRALLDYAKVKKITVDNIVRVLTTFNDRYYIYNKECIIPIADTGITEPCKQQMVHALSMELMSRRCVAIRDLESFSTLPRVDVQWTEWLVYSVLKQMNVSTITVTLSSNRFKDAIPIVAMIGEDTAENICKASCRHFDTDSISNGVDNLDDLDLLLENIIDFNDLGD